MKKRIAVVAAIFFILPSYAGATVSLGSVSDSESIIYSPLGGDAQLKYSFFNKGDENLTLVVRYVLLNEGTMYDLEKYDARIHLMYEPYPSTMMNTLLALPPPLPKSLLMVRVASGLTLWRPLCCLEIPPRTWLSPTTIPTSIALPRQMEPLVCQSTKRSASDSTSEC